MYPTRNFDPEMSETGSERPRDHPLSSPRAHLKNGMRMHAHAYTLEKLNTGIYACAQRNDYIIFHVHDVLQAETTARSSRFGGINSG